MRTGPYWKIILFWDLAAWFGRNLLTADIKANGASPHISECPVQHTKAQAETATVHATKHLVTWYSFPGGNFDLVARLLCRTVNGSGYGAQHTPTSYSRLQQRYRHRPAHCTVPRHRHGASEHSRLTGTNTKDRFYMLASVRSSGSWRYG